MLTDGGSRDLQERGNRMSGTTPTLSPGELIHARGRERIVLNAGETLPIRPLTGSEYEIETIVPELEMSPVRYAAFDPPDISRTGPREPAQLLFGEADRRRWGLVKMRGWGWWHRDMRRRGRGRCCMWH